MNRPFSPGQDIVSVSTLNRLARHALEERFPLLWVAGEVSNLSRPTSGHVYFTLKDDSAQVRCVMFRSRAQLLPWILENGKQVEAQALVTLFEPRGDYQLNVEALRQAGLGRLFEAFARQREKLESEGLFAAERKRPLPRLPQRIGVVSSAQAAALRDVLVTLGRRAPHLPVILFPTLVQGDAAPAQIVAAIDAAGRRDDIDVLIVARGGGSIEDLWAFNDEAVARAIAACPKPVVCGIGHEIDTTIADLVADLRAATPTAAAELVSAGWVAARDTLRALAGGLGAAMRAQMGVRMQRLDLLASRIAVPAERLARHRQTLALLATRLAAAALRQSRCRRDTLTGLQLRLDRVRVDTAAPRNRLALLRQRMTASLRLDAKRRQHRLDVCASALALLNPDATLARGFSIVRDAEGRIVRDSRQLQPAATIGLRFAHGTAQATVSQTGE